MDLEQLKDAVGQEIERMSDRLWESVAADPRQPVVGPGVQGLGKACHE